MSDSNAKDLQKRIGEALRARREHKGLSQESFAATLRMHRTYYSAIERGEKNLTLDTLRRICTALSVSLWEVFKEAA